jgi:hypothetical protein
MLVLEEFASVLMKKVLRQFLMLEFCFWRDVRFEHVMLEYQLL